MTVRHLRLLTPLAFLMAAAPLAAQGVNAQLSGTVQSSSGGQVVAGATVVIRNQETGFTRTVQTDGAGRYIATALPVGPYGVTVSKEGFQTASNIKVNLNLGDAAPLMVRLAPTATATVEVTAVASQVDTDRASAVNNISPDALVNLPIKGRSFTDFALLTPQVTIADRGNIAIGGQRGVNTSVNIDGGDYNEPFFGGGTGAAEGKTPFTVSIEAIREFQVVTDGASAEFGRMGGGYLNAITKSGTNDFTGSLFFYARPQSLVAKDHLTGQEVDDFKTQQYGFSFGGPLIKDKLFFFVAYDGQREDRPTNFKLGGNNTVVGWPLDSTLYPNDAALLSRASTYSIKANSDVVFLRLDWIVNQDHAIQFRVNTSNFKGDVNTASLGSNFLNTYDNTSTDDVKTLSIVGQWNWTINSNWLNEFRLNYVKDELPRNPRSTAAQVSVSNVATYGGYTFSREFETKRTQFSEILTYVTPQLQVRGGIDVNRTAVAEVFASTSNGNYSFSNSGSGASFKSSLQNFRDGNWNTYAQRFGLNGLSARESGTLDTAENEMSAFLQADWRVSNTFKVGLGLRWDRQEHPDFAIANFNDLTAVTATTSNPNGKKAALTSHIPTDTQFSPRLSFTWTPEADNGRSVIRGSFGRYVSRQPSVFLYQVYTVNGVRAAQVTFTSSQAGTYGIPRGAAFNANNPFVFASIPGGTSTPPSDIFTWDQDFKNPSTDRLNLGAERLFGGWVLGLSASYAKAKNLERLYDSNLGTPTLSAEGRLKFPQAVTNGTNNRPNTNYRQMDIYKSDAESKYKSVTLSAKYQKADSPLQAGLFYTWSKDEDNDSNERNFSSYSTQNTQRLADEWGPSNNDRTHVITGYVSFLEKRWTGIQSGFNVRYLSGSPYSATASSDLNNDGVSGNDRLIGSTRNGYRTGKFMNVDLKLSREWRFAQRYGVTVSAEIFNLFNHTERYDRTRWNGVDATPGISLIPSVTSSPRQVQLGARFAF
ncbi:MAG: TonB-dependent receptor [Holophagaceae bacterium]|nr:TonB-dependent receptor [Holophagaceae bacterium]